MNRLASYKKGKIFIKPENKGKFNATKKATGKTTEELTHSKNPVTKKRAVFAQNSAEWSKKHKKGGVMNCSCGGMLYKKKKGVTKHQTGGVLNKPDTMRAAIDTANKVTVVPKNYTPLQSTNNKDYFAEQVTAPKAIPSNTGKPTDPNKHHNWLVGQLQGGVTPQELIDKGHMSSTALPKYNSYYIPKVVYTEKSVLTNQPVAQNTTPTAQARRIDFGWNSKDVAKYIYPNDRGEYTHDTKEVYVDRKTNKVIDMAKSYDQSGKYIPSFMEQNSPINLETNKGTYTKGAASTLRKGGILLKNK